jgi:lipopolysaccharide biosynthesis regulator YciM
MTLTAMGRFAEAEAQFLSAIHILDAVPSVPAEFVSSIIEPLSAAYDAWNTAEPGQGYDARAAEWRAKLEALTKPPVEAEQGEAEEKALDGSE